MSNRPREVSRVPSAVVAKTLVSDARSKIVSWLTGEASAARDIRPCAYLHSIPPAAPISAVIAEHVRASIARSRTAAVNSNLVTPASPVGQFRSGLAQASRQRPGHPAGRRRADENVPGEGRGASSPRRSSW